MKDFQTPMEKAINFKNKKPIKKKDPSKLGIQTKFTTITRIRKLTNENLGSFIKDKDITKKEIIETLIEIFLEKPGFFKKGFYKYLGKIKTDILYKERI